MYEQPTIEPLDSSLGVYLLRDARGNLMGAGSPDVLGILLSLSKRCTEPVITLGLAKRKKDKQLSMQ